MFKALRKSVLSWLSMTRQIKERAANSPSWI